MIMENPFHTAVSKCHPAKRSAGDAPRGKSWSGLWQILASTVLDCRWWAR